MANFPDIGSTRRVNVSKEREILVVPMLTVENVMRMLVCSRSSAYEHMNRALGRTERAGTLLRVRLDVFESYLAHTLKLAPVPARPPVLAVGVSDRATRVSDAPVIRVAKPPRSRR